MNTISGFKLHTAIAIFVLISAMASEAWAAPISVTFAGTGYDTSVDNLGDGLPINISLGDAKGSFGASRVDISAEFFPLDVECESGYEFEVGLLYAASAITFENQSQLFGFSNQGWMCINMSNGHYYGQAIGVYGGGTGRFEGATGEWVTDFDGFRLEPPGLSPVGFRSISGVTKGNVELP